MGDQRNHYLPHYSREASFICNVCSKSFLNQKDVKKHMIDAHCNSQFYKCHLCQYYSGSNLNSLFQHQIDKHDVTNCFLACPLCVKFLSPNETEVVQHFMNVHSKIETGYGGKYCRPVNKSTLDAHFTEYVCVFSNCRTAYQNSELLFRHYMNNHFPRLTLFFNCSECEYMFPQKTSLNQHKRDRHGVFHEEYNEVTFEFNCSICSFKTCDKKHYQRHYIKEHPNDFFICPIKNCNFETELFWSITQHVVDKHLSNKGLVFLCHECETEQVSWEATKIHSLIQHLRDKHSVENYCSLCGTYEEDLADHIMSEPEHSQECFSCSMCKEDYDEKYELVDHISDNHVNIIPPVRKLCFGGAL